ncbi:MAG: hypoxanthine phosphoribosyltransferase [Deltaproteobacteria bacterium]|nr:hypoxanthine phosphoribosyltransferase [Deltaproteobacteria bacterium]
MVPEISVLIPQEEIQKRVEELGSKITRDYSGKSLTLLAVLKGAFVFMSDLARCIDLPLTMDFLGLSSYGDKTETSGVVRITSDLTQPVKDRDLLIVEDIVDSGLTMNFLYENIKTRLPRSIKVCSFLDKPGRRRVSIDVDYVGFRIEDRFVVGYGMDYKGLYRNLPYLGALDIDSLSGEVEK